ncbi:Calx-beta domain-containing protein [Chitinophaga skermanii]|uniref:Calx-beta domain-containing protein n=1 Tax=Chitinophaga skermanii TaxID=331697 RepID=UPI001B87A6E9|nr:Calx-beta domain-containing protein [Chitinophaga skermanii]
MKLTAAATGFAISGTIDVAIEDEEVSGTITMTATATTITEGNPATTVTVSLPSGVTVATPIVINLSKSATSTAANTDHDAIPASVTIAAGATTTTFTVRAVEDDLLENDETLVITGINSDGFTVSGITFTIKDKTSTIPANVAITLTADSTTILEGNNTKVFVRLPSNITTTEAITVNLSRGALSDAALQTNEYSFPTTVTIPANSNEGSFTLIASADDNVLEGLENLQIAASANVFGTTSTTTTTVGIADKTSTIAANKVITITAPTSIKEGETKSITASLPSGISTATPITVTLTNNGSTATAADFTGGLPTTITIASTTGSINVSPIADNTIEGTEYLKLTAAATGFTISGTIDIAIEDEEVSGNITMTAAAYVITEGDAATTVTVKLPTGVTTNKPVVVTLSKKGTSSAANTDHTTIPASVTINAGATTATFTVRALEDDILEGDETLVIEGTNTDGYLVDSIKFTIKDKTSTLPGNVALTLVADSASIYEGNSTKVTVSLPTGITTATPITVTLARGSGSSASLLASEYSFPSTVIIPAGGNEATFTLQASPDDNVLELLENLQIRATATIFGTNASATAIVGIKDITSTIPENKIITIDAPVSVIEGETKVITAMLPSNITASYAITVSLTNNGSTATAADFTGGLPSAITIAINSGSGSTNVSPVADNLVEGVEKLKLNAASAGFTINGAIDIDILDEVPTAPITMTATSTTITEGNTATTVTVSLPTGVTAAKAIVINLSKDAASTADNTDHDPIPATVTIPVGASSTTFTVKALDDNLLEGDETLTISGTNTFNFLVNSITFTIKDKTSTIPANVALSLTADSTSILEGNSTKVYVRLPNTITTTQAITVNITRGASSSAALQASEYNFPATVTIPAGSNEGSFTLTASADDNILEGLENLQIAASANVFGTTSTANVTVGIADKTSTIAANKVITISAPTTIKEGETKSITASLPTGISTATPIVVTLTNNGSTATAADFAGGLPTTITIASTTGTINISPIADNIIEGTEYLKLTATATGFTVNGTIDVAIEDEVVSGTISITAASTTITEGDAATTVTVSLPTGVTTATPIVVNLSKSATSTAANTDHDAVPASVTIAAGATTATFTVRAIADDLLENDETLVITGTNSDGFTVNGITFTIKDKTSTIPANVALTLVADSTSILEGNSTKVTVRLPSNITTTQAITVNLTRGASSSAALQASEYSFPATVTIPAGSNEGSFTLTASADDNILEGLENLQIAASANVFGTNSIANVTVGIADKTSTIAANKVITISAPTTIKEGETKPITASLPTGISTATPIVVTLTNNGSTATAADFTGGLPTTITIVSTTGTINVSPIADNTIEGTEFLKLTAAATGFTVNGTIDVAIEDEDVSGTITMTASNTTITEGDAATTVTVSLPSGLTAGKPIVVTLSKSVTSTAANTDHDAIPTSVTIAAGASTTTFTVRAITDNLLESDETLVIAGTNTDGFTVNGITFTIKDKTSTIPANVALTLVADSTSILEGNSTKVTVRLPNNITTTQAITVNLTRGAASSAALQASEYSFPATVIIPAGSNEGSFTLTASADDNILEGLENLQIAASANVFGSNSTANVTVGIADKTSTIAANKVITISAPTTIKEGEAKSITASLPTGISTATPIVITLTNNGSTATAADFTTGLPTTITIASTTGTVNISPIADNTIEGTEYLKLTATATGFTINGNIDIAIEDEEVSGTISMTAANTTITEGDAATTVTVSLPSGFTAGKPMVVNLAKSATSTAANTDHSTIPTSVTIPAGASTVTFTVSALEDGIFESDESLIITGSNTDGFNVTGITFMIKDKTSTIPANLAFTLTADSTTILEGNSTKIIVSLPTGITTTQAIVVNLTRGTASNPKLTASEYSFPATVTIPVNGSSASFILTASDDDNILEPTEDLQIVGTANIFGRDTTANVIVGIADKTSTIPENKVLTIFSPSAVKEGETQNILVSLPSGIIASYPIVVTLTNNGSTASAADFAAGFPASITINAGASNGIRSISPVKDGLLEGTERLILTATTTGFTTVGTINIDIIDEDIVGGIHMAATATTITEGDAATTVTVSLPSGVTAGKPIVVNLAKSPASTTANTDHDPIPASVTIPAGATSATFDVKALEDGLLEGDETLIITGTNPDGYVVNNITFTVKDKTRQIPANVALQISADSTSILEGNSTKVTISLPATITTSQAIMVNLTRGAATSTSLFASEYSFPSTATIPANGREVSFTLTASNDDNILELLENLQIVATADIFGTTSTANVTVGITDKTSTIAANKVITLAAPATIKEGETKAVTATLPSGITTAYPITLALTNNGSTATAADFTGGMPTSITIPAASGTGTINISPINDGIIEGTEKLSLTASATGFTINGQINIDILDGETNGTITMYASPTTITEGDAASVVTVSLPSGIVAGKDMVINLTKDASSTAASNDHDPIPATVTILQGKTTAEFNIKALTDNLLENDETLQINGTSADGYAVNSITFTIKDKTSTIPGNTALNITADSAAIFEGSTSNVWVRLPSHITTTVPITVNLARGAATDVNLLPSEYSFPASVTIPAGSNEVMFTLQATADDHLLELTESLQIAASATIFGNNASANAHIDIKDITGTIAANKVITINAPTSIKEGETKTITASLPSGIKATYDIVVTLTNNGSTASPADFTGGFPTQITITAGSTSGTVNITAIDDHLIENTERLSLTPAATGFTFIGNINVDVIDANTSSVNIRMTATNYTITEGDAATTVTVQLPTGIISTNDIIVQLHKDATSTLQDAEHDAIPTSVTIPAGKSNATFTVRVPMDDTLELAETLIINGTNTDGYVVESITFNVLDKTSQIAANRVISFTPATSDVLEGNSVSIVATLPANIYTAYPLVVNLSKNIASTASNTDHSVLPGTIVIPANAHQSAALQIDAAMDNIIGNTKTLLLNGTLTGFVINGASITIKDATGTIPSNKVITVTIDSSSIHEGSTTMVTYSLPPGITAATAITIQLRIDPASTTDAMDIAGLPVSFVIAPGESQAQFEIEINRDGERESNETLILSGVAAGYTVQKSNVMTIIGDVTFPPGTEGEKIRVPRGISPNGDGVGNDYMYIENIEKYTHNEVVVMNRWGGIVYKAYGYNNRSIRFDGKSNTGAGAGNNVTDGSYFYVIYVWNENGVRERFTGYIVIKR